MAITDKTKMISWLVTHRACSEAVEWATAHCASMQEAWDKCERGDWMVWAVTREGVLSDRELHEFSLWCAEQVRQLMIDPRSLAALDTKRRWLDGEATNEELAAARDAAEDAAEAAAAAARDAADAARAAAWAVARAAARAAAWAVEAAAEDAARAAQAGWLRENTKPSWEAQNS